MFINFTNHPCANWSNVQIEEAKKFGEIKDLPFPAISPYASKSEIQDFAQEYVNNILALLVQYEDNAVLCQGEFSLCVAVIEKLKAKNVKVLCACSERRVVETFDGQKNIKKSEFQFVGFREM